MERKITAILAVDVAGFSKMMEEDEERTLDLLKNRREIIDAEISAHGGQIFGTAGDSVIAQFDSPVRATECGVQFQNKMQALNQAGAIGAVGAGIMGSYRLYDGRKHKYTPALVSIISLVIIIILVSYYYIRQLYQFTVN